MKNAPKSLKMFFRKSSIEKEVNNKWDTNDRLEYLKKHCNDEKQSPLLKRKVKIVFDSAKKELVNEKGLVDAILKNRNTKDLVFNDKTVLEDILENQNTKDSIINNKVILEDVLKNKNTKNSITSNKTVLEDILENQNTRDSIINNKIILEGVLKNKNTKNSITSNKTVLEDILNNKNTKDLIVKDKTALIDVCKNDNMKEKIKSDRNFRKMLLADSKVSYEELKRYFNLDASVLDPEDDLSVKDTGVYLWKIGYTVKRFLGAGGFGVVWECTDENGTNIAVKVVKKDENGAEEIKNAKELYKLFSNDEKAKKYFNLLEAEKGKSPILKAVLAIGDLYKDMKNKKSIPDNGKTIDSILRNATQALKSVIRLHSQGYSHNDIKLQNFLKIGNWSGKKEKEDLKSTLQKLNPEIINISVIENIDEKFEKLCTLLTENKIKIPNIEKIKNSKDIGKEEKVKQMVSLLNETTNKKVHEHRVQLADFGSVTPIPKSGEKERFAGVYTPGYVSETDKKFLGKKVGRERIEKRDVYALGKVFQKLLARNNNNAINEIKGIERMNINGIENSKIYGILKNMYQGELNGDEKRRISKFLAIIIQMLKDNYNERITLEKALEGVQGIRTIKIEA